MAFGGRYGSTMMLKEVTNLLVNCFRDGNKVLTFGVGGNAANAIHFAAELAGKYERYEDPLPCIDLCSNPSVISAIATDFGWEHVFERQIRGLAKPGDVIVAFSISTKGIYLYNAIHAAVGLCSVVLICGRDTHEIFYEGVTFGGTHLPPYVVWELDSDSTPWVQEEQLKIIHQICAKVKERLVKEVV